MRAVPRKSHLTQALDSCLVVACFDQSSALSRRIDGRGTPPRESFQESSQVVKTGSNAESTETPQKVRQRAAATGISYTSYAIDAPCTKLISYPPSLHKTPASRPSPILVRPAPLSPQNPPARPRGRCPRRRSAGSPFSQYAAPCPAARALFY